MANPTEILRELEPERFHEILSASPKPFREELFRRAGVRVKGGAFSVKSVNKNRARADKLLGQLKDGMDLGDEVTEEVIRNYLYTQRPMLNEALDHFGVVHDNGLTDDDLSFIDALEPEKGRALKEKLEANHPPENVSLYLAFMNIPV